MLNTHTYFQLNTSNTYHTFHVIKTFQVTSLIVLQVDFIEYLRLCICTLKINTHEVVTTLRDNETVTKVQNNAYTQDWTNINGSKVEPKVMVAWNDKARGYCGLIHLS